jgi:outer membrane biosynthesis protein TonB
VPAPYYIYVNGRGNCKRPQPDIDTARTEAKRLYDVNCSRASVSILETFDVLMLDPNAPPPPPPEVKPPTPPVEKSAAKPQKAKKQPPAPEPKPAPKPVVVEVRKKRRIEVPSAQS